MSELNFDWTQGYPSTRLPVFGRNVVATSHPLAAQAGLQALQLGGNAMDAAIAAAAAMTICEPCSNGLGSDLFCLVWDGRKLHGLNASGRAPAAWTTAYFASRHGRDAAAPPVRGWDSVTVPGMVGGWAALHQRFGKRAFADLLEPAAVIAERGYAVSSVLQHKWQMASEVKDLVSQPGFAEAFLPRGRAPQVGEVWRMPAAARALRLIGATRGEAFYRGEIAAAVARQARAQGGALTEADFAACAPEWVEPLAQDYRGYTLHEIPPNGQGIAAQIALGLLQHFDLASLDVDSADCQHLQIEAMKLAFADVYRYVSEPASMTVSAEQMLAPDYLAERARLIDPRRAQAFGPGNPAKGGTIYLSTADESGMMVSLIQSNFMGFGSGVVVGDWGLSLQNRGHGFSLAAESPNVVAPAKRPFHTIIPAFLTHGARPQMSFGVMGANMQPQGHVQTLVRMLDHRQQPQAACDAPRWRFNAGLSINVEPQASPQLLQGLVERGHQVERISDSYQDFGAGQFVWSLGDPAEQGYVAASDPRRDGCAAVW